MDIREELKKRILILDGGMGTFIQQKGIKYDGNNDALCITRPDIIYDIHKAYVDAGADIISTCTFGANAISQEGYNMQDRVGEMNRAAVSIARKAADTAGRNVWVMGSIGPSPKSLFIIEMMMDPAETLNFDLLTRAYYTQADALAEGGVDGFLVETITDMRNAEAALTAIRRVQQERGTDLPVMVSASIMNTSGCLMTGVPLRELYDGVSEYRPMSFGLNCSFGGKELYPIVKEIAEFVKCAISIFPNAGLPTARGYEEKPCDTADYLERMATDRLINIAGGCCGTTPAHIREIANRLQGAAPRIF
ncbi:MAG: homocysteine S-methyltransferase family protein [Bacteroidaceae bacterium]|jgi:5-methyltetrahydrofolate--homocysteine methyltransferase|nr:homocysteine S-methyltransferase family protein [Bacteroidaceae bacterium]OPZ48769.1 MAG: Methionine synthase [Bacteroidetes bacterium ADurb.BinA104]MBP8603145.1 homocysteine S-methyltransferase family protein [Bacteroidaceae bacterium]HOD68209.1 homocysteine S-methyltransferase family protein [Bacteroidaceae bacterium]HPB04551.1 homocysteine S-methyltransferase family protein [Bacteroidaceae bacterium]